MDDPVRMGNPGRLEVLDYGLDHLNPCIRFVFKGSTINLNHECFWFCRVTQENKGILEEM